MKYGNLDTRKILVEVINETWAGSPKLHW